MSLTNYRTLPREPQSHVVYTPLSAVCPCCGNKNKFIVVTEEAEDSNQLRKNSRRQGNEGHAETVSLCTVPGTTTSQRAVCDDCVLQKAANKKPLSLHQAEAGGDSAGAGFRPHGLVTTEVGPPPSPVPPPAPPRQDQLGQGQTSPPQQQQPKQTWRQELAPQPKTETGALGGGGKRTWRDEMTQKGQTADAESPPSPALTAGNMVEPRGQMGRPMQAFSPKTAAARRPPLFQPPAAQTLAVPGPTRTMGPGPMVLGQRPPSVVVASEKPNVYWKRSPNEGFGMLTVVTPDGKQHLMKVPIEEEGADMAPQLQQGSPVTLVPTAAAAAATSRATPWVPHRVHHGSRGLLRPAVVNTAAAPYHTTLNKPRRHRKTYVATRYRNSALVTVTVLLVFVAVVIAFLLHKRDEKQAGSGRLCCP